MVKLVLALFAIGISGCSTPSLFSPNYKVWVYSNAPGAPSCEKWVRGNDPNFEDCHAKQLEAEAKYKREISDPAYQLNYVLA